MSDVSGDKVGYGRPPLHSRFQKGQSGNPAGRRAGSKNVSSMIAAAMMETVAVNEHGHRRKISKMEAACKQLANKAAGGDAHATKLLVELLYHAQVRDEAAASKTPDGPEIRRAADEEILKALALRLVQPANGSTPDA
jgi:hypothetical protein